MHKAHFLYIDPTIDNHEQLIDTFNHHVKSKKHIFLFLFMDGCGPCNETKPKWNNIKKYLKNNYVNNNELVISAINQKLFDKLNAVGNEPMGYPTLRYINAPMIEEYEDADISKKDRSTESFADWIACKLKKQSNHHHDVHLHHHHKSSHGGAKTKRTRKHRKTKGGKWSLKYKRSINCKRPKGFSQRQHCKYGRKRL